jgi:hypothetical protein
MNEALVVFAHEKGIVLEHNALGWIREAIQDAGGGETFSLNDCGVDYDASKATNAIMVGKLQLADDGPGDWPGSREVVLQLLDLRSVTREEWDLYCEGGWIWPKEELRAVHPNRDARIAEAFVLGDDKAALEAFIGKAPK